MKNIKNCKTLNALQKAIAFGKKIKKYKNNLEKFLSCKKIKFICFIKN